MSHKSLFTYSITRPYPFKWFTPVTIIFGLLLAGLLSWLNFASNGFDMVVSTTSDPNTTTANVPVLQGLPALLTGNFKPKCQPTSLSIGNRFYTSHNGLRYEILEIGQHRVSGNGPGFSRTLPALIYSNNILEDCNIQSVSFEIESQDRAATQIILSTFGIVVRSYVYCNVNTLVGTVTMLLMIEYDNNPATIESDFVSPNKTTKASLWWGQSMLETYYNWLAHDMSEQRSCTEDEDFCTGVIRKARFIFRRPDNVSLRVEDILDPHFLRFEWYIIYQKPDTDFGVYYPGNHSLQHASDYIREATYPSTWWAPAEKLAKSAWSTVLVDLGQSDQSNILLNDTKLEKFTSDFDQYKQHRLDIKRGPSARPYNPASNLSGPLGTTRAVINTAYICNVPQRKSAGVLVWLILLADLVFLQLAWKIFKLIVDAWMEKRREESQFCAGCLLKPQQQIGVTHDENGGDDESSTVVGRDSQSKPLSARTRSLIVGDVVKSKTM